MNIKRYLSVLFAGLACISGSLFAQNAETRWVDSVYNSLTLEQRVAQLICMRANQPDKPFYQEVGKYIKRYNIGGVCFFRADPIAQVEQTNQWQTMAQTPLMVSIDAEWGLGMRVRNTISYPYQMTLGAISDNDLIYRMGQQVAEQCQRMGIQVDFAPVVDVNSNAANPVIGMRSFGEDPRNVGEKGAAYALGMQSKGLITTMKHFPGHGNTSTDSHLTLPTVNATLEQVQQIELAPFRYMVERGVNGAMVGHLYFPAIEPVENTSSSLSKKVVTDLLKRDLGFQGLIFTDGLDMKGVSQTVSPNDVPFVAFMAGNDVLILPHDVPFAIKSIREAAERDPQVAERVEESCKKILTYKYRAGLNHLKPVAKANLVNDLNDGSYIGLKQELFDAAVTLLRNNENILPLAKNKKIAVVTVGNGTNDLYEALVRAGYSTTSFAVEKDQVQKKAGTWLKTLESYELVVFNVQKTNMLQTKNYGVTDATVDFFNRLTAQNDVVLNLFACPYALDRFRVNNSVKGLIVAYEDNMQAVNTVLSILTGAHKAQGVLPVSTAKFRCGDGIRDVVEIHQDTIPVQEPQLDLLKTPNIDKKYEKSLDSVAQLGILEGAYPGCQVLAMKGGRVIYDKCFGNFTYGGGHKVQPDDVYDVASLTKIFASTLALMKLYEDGLVKLNDTLGTYFPYLSRSNKGRIKLIDILTHQTGMKAWIPFHLAYLDANGPKAEYFSDHFDMQHTLRVAENLYADNDMKQRIIDTLMLSPVKAGKKYLYCDMGFYFVPDLVEQLTNRTFEDYLTENFYTPLQLKNTGFHPLNWRTRETIAPTEDDKSFRYQLIWGDVHDQAAALMGGVSGHAGLFSNAHDLAVIMQMLLDGGSANGRQLLKPSTIKYFTTAPFTARDNRRALGFDKLPISKKGPATASKLASMASFGHTGFTGTFAWADPENDLLIIFLSNRVYPDPEINKLSRLGIRTTMHDILYDAVK